WAWAQMVVSPLSRIVFVMAGQELKLIYDLTALSATLGALYGGHALGYSLMESVALLSALQVVAYGVYFLLLLQLAQRPAEAKD
ncbi:MAG: hypothetical protein NTW87_23945, partial [Planctomycetota bacterium]|nr:hypothetical protein [Planctomycetota bacterium]